MNSLRRCVILTVAGFLSSAPLCAQKTAVYYDPQADYYKAVELFDHRQFASARELFDKVVEHTARATDAQVLSTRSFAQYYRAICALKLLNPDGELLLADFLRNYPSHPKSNLAHYFLGEHHYNTRNYSGVISEYEQVNTRELSKEELEDYKFRLGYAYFFKQDFEMARPLLSESRASQKYYYPAHYYHGFILFKQGKHDEAIADFNKVQDSPLFGKVVPFYIASIYFEQGQFDRVIDYVTPMLDDTKQHYYIELNQLLGKAWFEKANYAKALPYLEYYDKYSRKVSKPDLFQLGYVYYKTGRCEDASKSFKELIREQDSIGQNAHYLLADCYLKASDKVKARTSFREAANMSFDKDVQESALFHFGKLSYELGYQADAASSLQQFIKKYPKSAFATEAKELLTESLLTTKNYKEAMVVIETLEPKTPRIRAAYQKVACYEGMRLFNDKNYAEAETHFRKSLTYPIETATEALCHYWLGDIAYLKNDYDGAIREYQKFLELEKVTSGLPVESSKATAWYGLGYAYLKKENYNSSINAFEKALKEVEGLPPSGDARGVKDQIYADLLVRTADGYLMVGKKEEALAAYSKVLSSNFANKDYAYYQRGMLHGIMGNNDSKIADMQTITGRYPGSLYADDAQYQLANTYFLQHQYSDAIRIFETIVNESQGHYVKSSLQKLGLIHYELKNYDKSVAYFKRVAEEFPNTPESADALARVKLIAEETGRVDYYEQMPGANIAVSDSITYRKAEKLYVEEKYKEAESAMTDYLSRFPAGYYILDARYYRADCRYRRSDYAGALEDYEYVIARPKMSQYSETSYLRAAKILHYDRKDYARAHDHYRKLLQIASFKQNTITALKGLLYCSYELKRFTDTKEYARQLIAEPQTESDLLIDAHYLLAKIAYAEGDIETANAEFTKTSELTSGEKGIESRYYMAEILFRRGQLSQAEAACDDIIKSSSYDYWNVKSYILIADIYMEQNELEQAQATLQSIVDNYTGDQQLLNEARQKLDDVNRKLDEKSRLRSEGELFQE